MIFRNCVAAPIRGWQWTPLAILATIAVLAAGCSKDKPVASSPVNPAVRPLTTAPAKGNATDPKQQNAAAYSTYMNQQRAAQPK